MNTATPLASIQTLGRFLEEHLHASLPDSTSVQVRCDLQRGTLLVMAQHPGNCSLDAARVLTTLKQGLAEYSPPLTREARLFVRKAGEKQPHARASWQVQSAEAMEPPDAAETEPTEDEETGSQPTIPLYWM
ncbi:MAG: hypothetical protein HC925_07140, partial [Coleofasciculaceae cyanobacterium SM2_3_26]|nr:hypothetical protein [Coleofasciculaceae cyanobacterium SM2_3_26]